MQIKKATARTEGEDWLSNNWKGKFTVQFLHTNPRKHSKRPQGYKIENTILCKGQTWNFSKQKMFINMAKLACEYPFHTPFLPTCNCEIWRGFTLGINRAFTSIFWSVTAVTQPKTVATRTEIKDLKVIA